MRAFICDRCNDVMERAADNIVTVKEDNNTEDTTRHICDSCVAGVLCYLNGNE